MSNSITFPQPASLSEQSGNRVISGRMAFQSSDLDRSQSDNQDASSFESVLAQHALLVIVMHERKRVWAVGFMA